MGDPEFDTRWQLRDQFFIQTSFDFIDDGDGIGVLHLEDAQADRRFAVETGQLTEIRQTVLDGGEITKPTVSELLEAEQAKTPPDVPETDFSA